MLAAVYLVWGPLGVRPVRSFLDSYQQYPAEAPHDLVVVFNGVEPVQLTQFEAEFDAVRHESIALPVRMFDLGAYLQVAATLEHDTVCFLGSYSEILGDGWLAHMFAASAQPGVGLVGVAGSWETQAHVVLEDGGMHHALYQTFQLPRRIRQYPRFPNPSVRTSAFLLRRELFLSLDLGGAETKEDTYRIESGRNGITRQIIRRGLRPVIVGRDGRDYAPDEWPRSATYRSGGQHNLLISDRRAREWQLADANQQRRLSRRTWGREHL